MTSRRMKDGALYLVMLLSTGLILAALVFIIIYILIQGLGGLNWEFLTSQYPGRGIRPMLVTTVYVLISSLILSLPVGIITALYMNEYAGNSAPVRWLRLAVETLAGIPSIIYGLFGLLFFCRMLGFGQSIIAGALTLSIMILPVIITTTEEALKSIPMSYREGSLALGATKIQTIWKVLLPSALPGIATAVVLAAGRVVGESAPLLLTVGIARNVPTSILDSGRTLTVHLYYLTKEAVEADAFQQAFAAAAVLIIFVVIINTLTRFLDRRLAKKRGNA